MPIKCKLENWRNGWSGIVCREKGKFWDFPDAQKEIKRRNRNRPRNFNFDERSFNSRARRLADLAKDLKEKLKAAQNKQEFEALQALADQFEQEAETTQNLIDDFIQDFRAAERSQQAEVRAEAQRAANELREALEAKKAFRAAERSFEEMERIRVPSFPTPRRNPTNQPPTNRNNNQNRPNNRNNQPNKRVPTNYPVRSLFDNIAGLSARTKRELSAVTDLLVKGGARNIQRANDILAGLPGKALTALSDVRTQLGLEALTINRNIERIQRQGAGRFETGLGIVGRIFGTVAEELYNVPDPVQVLPVAETGGEILGRGAGRILDKTGAGDAAVDGVIGAAKGLDDRFGNFNPDYQPIDLTKPRRPNRFEEVNDPDAPERECVGIQCLVRRLF